MRERYAAHMANLFRGSVEALLIAVDYPQKEMNGPPFAVSEGEIRTLFGDAFEIERLEIQDVLEAHQRFKDRGLTALTESAYLLRRG
jgi:thiopurine S-methyltransferase